MNIIKRFLSRDTDAKPVECGVVSGGRFTEKGVNLFTLQPGGANERQLYDNLRYSVPIVDAAIQKIIRLTGGYKVICTDER
ncbi:MAG: serine/threonine protein phosphatase, partial [Oscillospiraceae bacterium]|nr:serine/threonine protein phosphatase [Oscillospiraceae bacterium]